MAKWIDFVEVPAPGVTKRWEVRAKRGDVWLGFVAWSNGWRKYALQPSGRTEWEQDCLRDVANFIEAQTRDHKAKRASEGARGG